MGNISRGVLHCHSEYSVRDSAMTVSQLVSRAKELGAPAVALTDHGILMGIIEFMKVCKEQGIKGIPGMEAYFLPSDYPDIVKAKLQHLILMAKNHDGYLAICNAVRDAYGNQINKTPTMNYEILEKRFGVGTAGHGNVIATSACMVGIVASILLSNESAKAAIPKIKAKRDKYTPVTDEFLDLLKEEEEAEEAIASLVEQRTELTAATKVSMTGLNRKLKTLKEGSEEYAEAKRQIEETAAKKAAAAVKLEKVCADIASAKKKKTAISQKVRKAKESIDKWEAENEKIEQLEAGLSSDAELYDSAKAAALRLQSIFGDGNFFLELQYHGIKSEKISMPLIAKIADECNIPVVAANDAHYATNAPEDIRARTLVAATRFNQVISPDVEKEEGYGELYIKSDDELTKTLRKILPKDVVERAMANIGLVVDACNVEFPSGTHYPVFKGGIPGETADQRLRRLSEEGIPAKYGKRWCKAYEDRMNYELGVISKMGYSDYLCIVQDFLEYGRSLAKECPEGVGYTIGPGRGSAAGSIVCYLSGITAIDPMKYDLLFERFLNPERVSMPEIRANHVNPIAQGCAA